MSGWGRGALRRIGDRLPAPVRDVVRRTRRGTRRLTVVVLLRGEPTAARRCLEQALENLANGDGDVLAVVLDADLTAMAEGLLADRPDARVLDRAGLPLDRARREAVAQVRSPLVMVLVPGADLDLPLSALDLDLGEVGVVALGLVGAPYQPASGAVQDLAGCPEVARRPLLARLVVERSRLEAALQHDDGPDPDGVLAALTLLAQGFRYEPVGVLRDVRPGSERSLYRTSPWPDLPQILDTARTVRSRAPRRHFPHAYDAGWLERDAWHLVETAEDASAEDWARFTAYLGDVVTPQTLAEMDLEPRVGVWLAVHESREDVVRYVASRRFAGGEWSTGVRDGVVLAVVPDVPGLPEELREIRPAESALRARLVRVQRDDGRVALELHAGIRYVDQRSVEACVTLWDRHGTTSIPTVTEVRSAPEVTRWMGQREQVHDDGLLVVRADLGELGGGAFRVHLRLGVDGVERETWLAEHDPHGSAGVGVASERGRLVVDASVPPWDGGVSDVVVDQLAVTISADLSGTAYLVGPDVRIEGEPEGSGRWRFPLVLDRWGLGERPAPTGRYRLECDGRPLAVGHGLLARLPEQHLTASHRVGVWALNPGEDPNTAGPLALRLDPPLGDDEAGRRRQRLLQTAYAEVREPLDPELVYFQAFTGQAATDHPLAIQQELRRRRPDLRVCWLVADSAATVPAGAEPVQLRSCDWYDVLARAGHVVTNIDLERWFRRRPDQQVLQTYHGYPSKRMGIDQWRARGFPESRIAQDLARSSGTWTALLTPQPDADRYYREQYAYDGTILSVGYPRDDVLVGPGRDERRIAARERLGVGDRRVLLYAPTWRDDLATNFRAARAEHHLHVERLADLLGDGWLVLLRGHRFHARGRHRGRLLDVTAYPEVNDLILAADAAVLDYSSLRFDFALTGRPALYLVPDLDRYTGRVRGFLQDYRDTAPGPLVDDTLDVVRELTSYDDLVARCADPIAAFNARFNTLADGHAAQRVVDAFFGSLVGSP